ncbi:MAG: hypothetical protein M3270_08060 [Thermoproteota archaeon]|nr:hypothetical protein [Thermoproteota archaeon]
MNLSSTLAGRSSAKTHGRVEYIIVVELATHFEQGPIVMSKEKPSPEQYPLLLLSHLFNIKYTIRSYETAEKTDRDVLLTASRSKSNDPNVSRSKTSEKDFRRSKAHG